ncbi:spondin domain-containing protein [Leptothoe sp. LEGE 181152]|uniref:PEP-CTERM sorting domain-containing protein n=1 Tax=Adonisia turfae CCMR0081 TaxID=2292702 RepID=A0A6M0REN4_9CYAN|nr:spondin domain-containing protein [Adonisia turfae]MDV3352325.1 spondin domain-containing protein [Leptothoe sp. LEGE 181152]NEZ54707.1 PEP-CTERM sorting domain-containing protein [Adonisia turfae CCMR0081]
MNKFALGSHRVALAAAMALGTVTTMATAASAATLRVTIENLAPINGGFLTPAWVGFHDGTFDLYDRGESLDDFTGLESLVEDGDTSQLTDAFAADNPDGVQATLLSDGPPPLEPGELTSFTLDVDPATNQYFSYASMVIPSNDAFIANGNPLAHEIFDDAGNFLGADFIVLGSEVLDGGTEVNDELPFSTAFLGQQAPDTGIDENGVVTEHPGLTVGTILGTTDSSALNGLPLNFTGADFTAPGYQVARFRVELVDNQVEDVPEPGIILGLVAAGGLVAANRKRKQTA